MTWCHALYIGIHVHMCCTGLLWMGTPQWVYTVACCMVTVCCKWYRTLIKATTLWPQTWFCTVCSVVTYNSPYYDYAGINELINLSEKADCKKNSKDECGRGTVVMDPWVNKTLTFQRKLAQNISLDRQQILGSHNSFNDRADGCVL